MEERSLCMREVRKTREPSVLKRNFDGVVIVENPKCRLSDLLLRSQAVCLRFVDSSRCLVVVRLPSSGSVRALRLLKDHLVQAALRGSGYGGSEPQSEETGVCESGSVAAGDVRSHVDG